MLSTCLPNQLDGERHQGMYKDATRSERKEASYDNVAMCPSSPAPPVSESCGICNFRRAFLGLFSPKDKLCFTIHVHKCILRLPEPTLITVCFRQGCVRVKSTESFLIRGKSNIESFAVQSVVLTPTVFLKRNALQFKKRQCQQDVSYLPSIARLQLVASPCPSDKTPSRKRTRFGARVLGEASFDLAMYAARSSSTVERRYVQLQLDKCPDPHASLVVSISAFPPVDHEHYGPHSVSIEKNISKSLSLASGDKGLQRVEHNCDPPKNCDPPSQEPSADIETAETFSFGACRPEVLRFSSIEHTASITHDSSAVTFCESKIPLSRQSHFHDSQPVLRVDAVEHLITPRCGSEVLPAHVAVRRQEHTAADAPLEVHTEPPLRVASGSMLQDFLSAHRDSVVSTETVDALRASVTQLEETLQHKTTTILELQKEMQYVNR